MDVIAHENPSPEPVVAELGVCPEVEIIPVISDNISYVVSKLRVVNNLHLLTLKTTSQLSTTGLQWV
jgi:hypothetical protein